MSTAKSAPKAQKPTYYITTPIYYTNGKFHLGHCYTTVVCDAIVRFKRMCGYDVFYLTGTDEHGQKVEEAAKKQNATPQQFVDELNVKIVELWRMLNISYDKFIRTTDGYHKSAVQNIFADLNARGYLYKSQYEGHYCVPCESFWTPSQLGEGGVCPDCGRPTHLEKEESYFFRLSEFGERLIKYYEQNPTFVQPVSRVNEMVNNFLKPGLKDLCVSRTSFSWGIPVTFEPGHVVYVWVDALSNYITALGYGSGDDSLYQKYWPADLHMVGKEITRFHTIIWPAILMALELPLPKQIYGHGWLLFNNDRLSKSKGNVVYPEPLVERYGADAVRYFLLREVPFGNDGSYTPGAFLTRLNSDLCNSLGNLVSRTMAMIEQYFGGVVPAPEAGGDPQDFDAQLISLCETTLSAAKREMDALSSDGALAAVFKLVNRANKYIDETMPWALAKTEQTRGRLGTVLYNLAETIRFCAVLLAPFLPDTAEKIYKKFLNLGALPETFDAIGRFGGVCGGQTRVEKGENIFPRYNAAAETEFLEGLSQQKI